jgi:hypothetical protein
MQTISGRTGTARSLGSRDDTASVRAVWTTAITAPPVATLGDEVVAMLVWILLVLVVGLLAWAGWRQKRYGGTATFDRYSWESDQGLHHSSYNPWGVGRHAGEEDRG